MKTCKGCKIDLCTSNYSKSNNTLDGFEGKCKDCRQDARRNIQRNCVVCNDAFVTAKKETRCCSYECIGLLRTERYTTEVVCGICQKEYSKPLSSVQPNNYCSTPCFSESVSIRMRGNRAKRFIVACTYCGDDVVRRETQIKSIERPFCNVRCFSKGIGKYRRNELLSDEDREIRRNYPEYREWRKLVLRRDGFKCQACGDGKVFGLNAHHILNYASNPEVRTSVENGITLCEMCHIDFHVTYGYADNNEKQIDEFLILRELEEMGL